MIRPQDHIDPVACHALWTQVLALQWDTSLGLAGAKPLEQRQSIQWFGTKDFFVVCALLQLDGHAVLRRWRRQRNLVEAGSADLRAAGSGAHQRRFKKGCAA